MTGKSEFTEFVRVLKEKNDIIEVIGSYVKLERRGYQYWACCPFHHEKTPSFAINGADKFYHCFGCGRSGDVITFIKEYENVDFMQAVQLLAARAGLEVPAYDDRAAEEAAAKKKKRDRLSALMKTAARFYLNNLYSGRAAEHLDYIAKRGLTSPVLRKFGIGASLDYAGLPAHLLANGFTPEECVESGACTRTEEGRLIDAEGGRLIIPIIDQLDDVIAFGGRVMKPTDRAKYKNTRETVLFNKSKTLFNINLVKKEKRLGNLSNLIMVEGYMDTISLYQAGFHNVVASMGTSLTKEQARLAKRYTDNVLISYDGDFAGQHANLRGLDILKDEGIKVRVVPMPEGLDPDDVVRQMGPEGYRDCLEKAMPLIDFRLLSVRRKYDLSDPYARRDFVKESLEVLKEVESAAEREELLARLSASSGISQTALLRDLEQTPSKPQQPSEPVRPSAKRETVTGGMRAARFVLAACLLSKPYAAACDLASVEFADEEHRAIAAYILRGRAEGGVRPAGLFDLMDPDGELSEVLNLDYGDNLEGPVAEKYFQDSLASLEISSLLSKKAEAAARFDSAGSDEERTEILRQIDEYNKKINRMKKTIGGKA